ncbi:MAG: hypothetical protein RLZZ40_261 [Actinomycetota bacterium]
MTKRLIAGKHRTDGGRHARHRSTRLRTALVVSLVALLTVGGTIGGYAWFLAAQFDNSLTKVEGVITETPRPVIPSETRYQPQNILLLGSDTRGQLGTDPNVRGQRSDVMMFIHLSGDRKTVHIMSIPRDTWVKIPCFSEGKINWAMSYGGAACAVSTVEKFLHTHIDHFALINFSGVKELADLLGGVTVDNPRAFTSDTNNYEYNHYSYKKGIITLKGARALAFVRERHAFPDGDVSRGKNQQLFIKGVISAITERGLFTNPAVMTDLATQVGKLLIVDPGLDSSWAVKTAVELSPFNPDKVIMFTMPIDKSAYIGSQYAILPDQKNLDLFISNLGRDTLDLYTPPKTKKVDPGNQNH